MFQEFDVAQRPTGHGLRQAATMLIDHLGKWHFQSSCFAWPELSSYVRKYTGFAATSVAVSLVERWRPIGQVSSVEKNAEDCPFGGPSTTILVFIEQLAQILIADLAIGALEHVLRCNLHQRTFRTLGAERIRLVMYHGYRIDISSHRKFLIVQEKAWGRQLHQHPR